MKHDESLPNPPKLLEMEHPYAELLAQGNRAYATSPAETAHFCRTHAHASPRPRTVSSLAPFAVAAAALVVLAVGVAVRARVSARATPLEALPETPAMLAPDRGESSGVRSTGVKVPSSERKLRDENVDRLPPVGSTRSRGAAKPPEAPAPPTGSAREGASTPSKAEPVPGPDCRELARRGERRSAEACYLERSSGSGLDAETALLEVARLRRDVLSDPEGALQALESYPKRFPNGALRQEADIARVALLTRLGRQSEALAESERLLDAPYGRERAFELRMLRGNIYRKSGNTARAAEEYAKAESLDGATPEATYFLGSCLEELGEARRATEAFRRYLEKSPNGKRATEVRERLERASP